MLTSNKTSYFLFLRITFLPLILASATSAKVVVGLEAISPENPLLILTQNQWYKKGQDQKPSNHMLP